MIKCFTIITNTIPASIYTLLNQKVIVKVIETRFMYVAIFLYQFHFNLNVVFRVLLNFETSNVLNVYLLLID